MKNIVHALIFAAACAAGCSGASGPKHVENQAPQPHPLSDAGLEPSDAGEPPPAAEFVPGRRLQPTFLQVGDARVFSSWYDTELKQPCSFGQMSGGTYCLVLGLDVMYYDAECVSPLISDASSWAFRNGPGLSETPHYAPDLRVKNGCAEVAGMYERGEPLDIAPGTVYAPDAHGDCVEQVLAPDAKFYEVGKRLGPAELVAVVDELHVGTGRVQASYQHFTDGSTGRVGWYDSLIDEECAQAVDGRGVARCFPKHPLLAFDEQYSEPTCQETSPLFGKLCGRPRSRYGLVSSNSTTVNCEPATSYQILRLEEPRASTVFELYPSGVCYPGTTTLEVWDTSPVEQEYFAEVERRRTTGRIQSHVERAGDGPQLVASSRAFWDEDFKAPCAVDLAADGTWRCMPSAWTGDFRDDACSRPVVRKDGCQASLVAVSWDGPDGRKQGGQITDAVTLPATRYERVGNACVAGGPLDEGYFDVAQLEFGRFAEAKVASD